MAFPCIADPDEATHAHVTSRTFSDRERIVFHWDLREKVPFSTELHGDRLALHFEKPVDIDWDGSLEALGGYVRQVKVKDGGQDIELTLTRPAQAREFLHNGGPGNEEVENGIDLSASRQASPRTIMEIPWEAPAALIRPHKKQAQVAKPPRRLARKQIKTPAMAKTQPPSPPMPVPVPAANASAGTSLAADTAQGSLALPETAVKPGMRSSPPPSASLPAPPADAATLAALSPSAGKAEDAPKATAATHESAGKESIDLPLKESDPLAVFVHNKTLWIVTSAGALTPDMLHPAGTAIAQDFKKLADTHAAILYAPLPGNADATVEKTAQGMRITLEGGPATPAQTLKPALIVNAAKQTLLSVPADNAAPMVMLRDPASGEALQIVPLPSAGLGLGAPRSFVEFTLLPSAQGLVVQKIADNVTVALNKGAVEISAPKGLNVSPELAQQMQEAAEAAENAERKGPATLFPYARWKLDDEKNLVPVEIKLFNDIAEAKTTDIANKARLKLLGIYLSEGLFAEARGMADDILRVSYKFYVNNKVAAMRAASYFFAYRISEAERDFSAPELMNDPEAAMWRTLCRELLGEGAETFDFVNHYNHVIHTYPPVFIQKLAIIAADRSINRKDYDTADAIFDILKRDNLDEQVKKYVDYMHAKILSENRAEEEAAKIWEQQAAEVDDPLIRARAEFSLVNMLLRQDKISHEEAIKRLEKLRIVWRGDELERGTLTLLGNLYLEDKQYSRALHTLRDIVLYYPEMPEAITTARKMEETFIALYNKGGADSMPPLEALSLFYEFRDLVPIGKEGDLMIRNLADRLVDIDLLDRAAMLLDHQIKKRLQGDERSRVGARLALIYLLNHQPKDAMETLKTTGYGDLPPDLQLTRLRLTAQALAQQGQAEKAIEVLGNDNSPDGLLLRLSIYWDNKDWTNVVSSAEEILGNRNDPSAALTAQESDVLLKLATAYVYEHDTGQIQYLRDYFTPLLKNNPNKDSFLFVTSESGAIDYENLANLDVDINSVKSFLDTYRDKVKKNGLSNAIN